MDAHPELMTVDDFLAIFRISRASFHREVNAGRLRAVKFGRTTKICRVDALKWLENLPEVASVDAK